MSTGQALGAVTGAIAGFVIGGPTGALYGAQIGMMAGGYLDPPKGPTMEGPRLSDLAVQTSTYGAFIPRLYGTVAMNGNVFWLENNQLKEVVKKKKSGGKGGATSATTKTYTYFATLAVGVCQGPVDGIRRIWAGPNLIYDAGVGDIDSIIASNATKQQSFSFYYGDDTQLPDSRVQAEMGVGNTPAYRGLCYVVIKDFALAKYGNAIPAFKFEVVKQATINSNVFAATSVVQAGVYNGGQANGSPRDSRGYANYCYQASLGGPVTHVAIRPDGSKLLRTLPADKTSIAPNSACRRLSSSLRALHYAFAGLEYISVKQRVTWGNDKLVRSIEFDLGSPSITAFAEMSEDIVYVSQGSAAAGYTISKVEGETVTKTVTLPATYDGPMSCWGDKLVTAWPDGSTVAVRVYSADLELIDSYSVAVAGISAACEVTHTGSATPVEYDKFYVFSNPDASVYNSQIQAYEIDLFEQTVRLFNLPEPSAWTAQLSGTAVNFGNVVGFAQIIVDGSNRYNTTLWKLEDQVETNTSLQEIITAECELTGLLSAADIDVSTLTDVTSGYRVAKIGSIRGSIEPLQAVWPFDAIQSGYQIKFKRRGTASVATVTIGELGGADQLPQMREMDSQLPNSLVMNYLDMGRNYDPNQQQWERPSTGAVNTRTMEVPVVLTATQAAQVVERLGYLYWLERTDFGAFTLPPTYSSLEPGDVITINAGYAVYELRLTSVNYKPDGSLECRARPNSASTYVSLAEADDVDDGATVGRAGPSSYQLLDIPVVDETLQNTPGIVTVMCGYTPSWSGGAIWRSPDAGQSWDDIQGFSAPCTFGQARGLLTAHAGNIIDYGRTLTVDLLAGELVGVTESQMLNGANIAAYGADGRWEIMRFTNATLNADSSYTISGLWRGDKGTEWATGLHQANDSFVLLDDPDGAFVGMATELIGVPRYYRGITSDADIDSDSSLTFTYAGANLKCLSPAHAAGTRSAGDLLMTWKRRTRVGGEWRDNVESSLGETTEAYEIDVMSGATVKRTITATSQTATYTSAQQVTDFGSAQSSITVRIYQLSSLVGRGYPLEVTL